MPAPSVAQVFRVETGLVPLHQDSAQAQLACGLEVVAVDVGDPEAALLEPGALDRRADHG